MSLATIVTKDGERFARPKDDVAVTAHDVCIDVPVSELPDRAEPTVENLRSATTEVVGDAEVAENALEGTTLPVSIPKANIAFMANVEVPQS